MDALRLSATSGLRFARDLDSLGRDDVERLQRQNLTVTVVAALRTPAVRERWPDLDKVVDVEDLARLPLLTPAELAEGCPPRSTEFLLDGDGPGLVLRSSGTSGRAKMMFHSWQAERQVEYLGARGVRAALSEPVRRVANCMFPGELNGAFFFIHGICRQLPALTFPLGSRTPVADTAGLIAEHAIDTVVASPAFGTELVTTGPKEALAPLRNFLYLGEALGEERHRAVTSAAPDLTVRSLSYSTNETGPVGYQCRRVGGSTHHVHEDGVVVEVVDEHTGEPVPPGTVGEVVVTPVADSGMALFRYRIGDRGRFEPGTCACGSAARLITLVGRTAQSMTVDVWTVSSDQLLTGLADLGVTDPADCQLQVLWEFSTYRVRLLLLRRTPDGITANDVLRSMRGQFQMNKVLTSPRCTAFTVERVDVGQFAATDRGKVPVLYQRLDDGSARQRA